MAAYVMTALEGKTPPENSQQSLDGSMIASSGPESVEIRSVVPWVHVTPEMIQKARAGVSSSLITAHLRAQRFFA